MQQPMHRRAAIINNLAEMFENNLRLTDEERQTHIPDPNHLRELPAVVKTVQKRYVNWTALDQQDALPAILLTYGDDGSTADSEVIGFIDETFPITVTAVMKEGNLGFAPADTERNVPDRFIEKALIDLASDMHYSLAALINNNPTFGVEGVLPERTRIANWSGSEGATSPFEIIKFRIVVVHRYHTNENP